ncbi:MAG: GNAT family N-acetyltransferase [Elusimicrobia bacterium]|nr:GNAT family N-acetyltransferase [Elusimicrobiota bacterium]
MSHSDKLEGRLVVLTPPETRHIPAVREILSDLKTMECLRYMAHAPKGWTRNEVQERFGKQRKGRRQETELHFIVQSRDSGRIAGSCGFNILDLKHRYGNFGIILHHPFWGLGLAAECHLLCFQYAFDKLGLHRVDMGTFVENKRMRKFFENLGIRMEGVQRERFLEGGIYKDNVIYALFEKDWPKAKKILEKKISKQIARRKHSFGAACGNISFRS